MRKHKARHRAGCITALLLSASTPLLARAEVVTLQQLEQKALQNRPALARDDARTRAAEADLRKAASAFYPQFALKADSTVGPGRQLVRVGSDTVDGGYLVQGSPPLGSGGRALLGYPRSGVELSGTATLYDFGRTRAATAAGREATAAALAGRAVTEEELRNAVRESYLGWLLGHELERMAKLTLDDAAARRTRLEALIGEGVRPSGELAPARADELLAKLEAERARHERDIARLAVERVAGVPLSDTAEPDLSVLDPGSTLPDASEQDARSRRALLARFQAAKAAADAQAKLNRPQLGIGASVGIRVSTQRVFDVDRANRAREDMADYDPSTRTTAFPLYGAGLTLTVPLWDGGFTSASVAAARAQADEVKAELAEFEAEQESAQRRAQLDAEHAHTRLATAQELVAVCEARLKDAEAGYQEGVANLEQVAQARAQLRRAETEALMARVDHAAARLRTVRKDAPSPGQ